MMRGPRIDAPLPSRRAGRASALTAAPRRFDSLRIRMITSGISSGNAVITAAMPMRGSPSSNASRMPSVASTCVCSAGPPPLTKCTVLKSPSVQIVESSVQTM